MKQTCGKFSKPKLRKCKFKSLGEKTTILLALCGVLASQAFAQSGNNLRSSYAGEENRAIKSLSADDINALKNGKGWGLAKAAELNGIPGPIHLLEMKREIGLSAAQVRKIQAAYQAMKENVVPLGLRLIALERELNGNFARGTITKDILKRLMRKIAQARMELRYEHLVTHLSTPAILTPHQIALYNKLRGYSAGSGHAHGAKGHKK